MSISSNDQYLNLIHHNQYQSNLNSCSSNNGKYGLCLNSNQINTQLNLSQNNSDLGDFNHEQNENTMNLNSPSSSLSPPKKIQKENVKCR